MGYMLNVQKQKITSRRTVSAPRRKKKEAKLLQKIVDHKNIHYINRRVPADSSNSCVVGIIVSTKLWTSSEMKFVKKVLNIRQLV
jgi:hypothetical protein